MKFFLYIGISYFKLYVMGSTSPNEGFHGPAKIMYEKFGFQAVEFLPLWRKDLGFSKDGSFSVVVIRSLREQMEKQIKNLKLWEDEAVSLHTSSTREIDNLLCCPVKVPGPTSKTSPASLRGSVCGFSAPSGVRFSRTCHISMS